MSLGVELNIIFMYYIYLKRKKIKMTLNSMKLTKYTVVNSLVKTKSNPQFVSNLPMLLVFWYENTPIISFESNMFFSS